MTSITAIKGIGEKTARCYSKIGIETVEDAVFYFPRGYITYEEISEGISLPVETTVAVKASVMSRPLVRKGRKYITSAKLACGLTLITATWFNMPYLSKSLKAGSEYVFRGRLVREGDHYHTDQPQIFTVKQYDELLGHINPVYPLTKGLTNNSLITTVKRSFEMLGNKVRSELYDIHFPKDENTLLRARKALVYDELLLFMLRLRMMKEQGEKAENDFGMIETAACERLIEKLPYRLTNAQTRVWKEVRADLCGKHSMRRLIQGDVGCGKTVIAALAAVMTAENRYQCALMVPTEILARQHYDAIKKMTESAGLSINIVLLTGSMSASAKKGVRDLISSGKAQIIIGTHALIYDKVTFNDLALVITDEQHRFGVGQRMLLSSKNSADNVHVLVMSATPIPRTLAIILYGDLSVSLIDEVPAHKLPVKNALVSESYRKKAYEFMDKEIKAGHQVYVICPLVEESEGMDAKNVVDTAEYMRSVFDKNVNIGILHGRMKGSEKNKVMEDFANGYIDILVSTTVVEVGVNVPNATVMMIEDAQRFGLAALHQLRGRIGRGSAQSYCIFMTSKNDPASMARLEILKNSNDGFKVAEEDLRQRGPGDMFGLRQSGELQFRLADIYSDFDVLKKASEDAQKILSDDPDLSKKEHEQLKKELERAQEFDAASTL